MHKCECNNYNYTKNTTAARRCNRHFAPLVPTTEQMPLALVHRLLTSGHRCHTTSPKGITTL